MDSDDDGVLEAARAIRPYLGDLIGPAQASAIDDLIAREFNSPASLAETAGRLRVLLEEHEDTAWFLTRVLADPSLHRPPYVQQVRYRGIISPAGDPYLVAADRFACPRGDYAWYRPEIGTPIPVCPTHHLTLIRN
jgi:hypothetical protein